MAKARKLVRSLEAAGWSVVARRGDHVQLRHPDRPQRLTLPSVKIDLPGEAMRHIADLAGLKLKGE